MVAAAQARDRLLEVADHLAQQGALRRAVLGERIEFALQHESPGDQALVGLGVIVVSHSHRGEVAAERYDCAGERGDRDDDVTVL